MGTTRSGQGQGQDFGGKDRAKHDGGKDASGQVPDRRKHPESPGSIHVQPESGTERDPEGEAARQDRKLDDDT